MSTRSLRRFRTLKPIGAPSRVARCCVGAQCVIRGYLSGSAWREYAASGTLAGEPLASALRESARLALPLFSPATKVRTGHDENITVAQMCRILGSEVTGELERRS